ncbi:type II secretion system protein GspL [Dokdonella sp.]|uniref:type II secretion system protein GspL n=1 Tax=Dokdonella sp. TaxID=2291710 RepID=UPI001B2F6723|nr:type II secretion system protein GspL [Dokdonella sp.]MBO9663876.1 type II secretion system protein GspL [Dokdonella sp.]
MPDRLYLRLAADGGLSWLRQAAGVREPASTPGVPPASALAAADEVVVAVPAEDVLLTEVELSARNRAQLLQALPYAVEDQLLAPVEDLHFAAARGEGGRVGVAVVAKQRLRDWLQHLERAGVRPDRMLPDSIALPLAADRATALIENGRATVRLKTWSAFACALEELPGWLAQLRAGLAPLEVHDFRAQPALALPTPIAAYRERQRDPLAFLAASPDAESINLLDGEFAPRHRRAGGVRGWRLAAVLAAGVAVLALADLGLEVLQLSRTDARLQTQATDALRKAFPDLDAAQLARMSPEQLMRGRLDRLRGGAESSGLLRVLGQLAPVLGGSTGIQTRGMEYRNGSFELALRAPDVATVDGVRERLVAAGLTAEVTAANPGADGVDGRIRIGGAR